MVWGMRLTVRSARLALRMAVRRAAPRRLRPG